MLRHFLWDYFKESGDLEAYMMYKELEYAEQGYAMELENVKNAGNR